MKKKTTLELVEQSAKVSLYSISFLMDRMTEFELFLRKFEEEAYYNEDYQRILYALSIILERGALERYFRPEGKIKCPKDQSKSTGICSRLSRSSQSQRMRRRLPSQTRHPCRRRSYRCHGYRRPRRRSRKHAASRHPMSHWHSVLDAGSGRRCGGCRRRNAVVQPKHGSNASIADAAN